MTRPDLTWGIPHRPLRRTAIALAAAGVLSMGAVGLRSAVVVRPLAGSLDAQVAGLRDGATLRLPVAAYGSLTISGRNFTRGVRIVATGSRFAGIAIRQSSGVTIESGTAAGDAGSGYAIAITGSERVAIRGMTITDAVRGVVISASRDVTISDNRLTGLRSDGINVSLSRQVVVSRNTCTGFTPRPSIFKNGVRVKDGDHPDCIQAWSRPTAPPTADLRIVDNIVDGPMQGVFLGNHVRNGVDDGGFDRVTITGNRVTSSMTNGIAVFDCRGCAITGNTVSTTSGARQANRPDRPVKAIVRVERGTVVACGNLVADLRRPDPMMARCTRRR